LVELETDVE